MRRFFGVFLACVSMIGCLCMNATAFDASIDVPETNDTVEVAAMRATGAFNMTVGAYRKTAADKDLPLAAGETVNIRANYEPEDASMDFGLVDPDGVFHYVNVTTGSINKTIKVPENGNYTLAIRNNSGVSVEVSGFVKY